MDHVAGLPAPNGHLEGIENQFGADGWPSPTDDRRLHTSRTTARVKNPDQVGVRDVGDQS
jgi:hypothetical protein